MASSFSPWDALPRVVADPVLRQLGLHLESNRCPKELTGRWRIDTTTSDGLCPFLKGLGMPGALCPAVGLLERTTELVISCPGPGDDGSRDGGSSSAGVERIRIEDKTAFSSRNVTEVVLDGREVETATRGGRKRYLLSGDIGRTSDTGSTASTVRCRLFQRGEGWETRQERSLCGDVRSRAGERLRERNVLVRPGKEDIVVDRYFRRVRDEAEDKDSK